MSILVDASKKKTRILLSSAVLKKLRFLAYLRKFYAAPQRKLRRYYSPVFSFYFFMPEFEIELITIIFQETPA
jgi:hypothetical protein